MCVVCVCVCVFCSASTPLCISACLFICVFGFNITNLYASWIVVSFNCVCVCVCLCVNSWHMVAILPWRQNWRKFQRCRAKAKILLLRTHTQTHLPKTQYRFGMLVHTHKVIISLTTVTSIVFSDWLRYNYLIIFPLLLCLFLSHSHTCILRPWSVDWLGAISVHTWQPLLLVCLGLGKSWK